MMSDEGERTCPLCAEEMDLTDQQLKPCRCGYEICVWCWHHIIDMAEKDDTEGRCPACRTAYDKERVVGMTANCERVVAEVNAEKKQKSQKAKPKTSIEARKHLNSVRVVQRNLVYIIGLPLNLADESLLERREYFGQYGRVLKVSISRPTGGAQAPNNSTFSVYITYTKEEEAVRCIQAVHNFVLDGKMLRACFGTTKYCRAWLRNMACNNPDCLYLHDVGCQEDSFTKDEIISAYTRSRVPAIPLINMHRRNGSVLPPPADDLCSTTIPASTSKVVTKGPSNVAVSQVKGSPDVGGSMRHAVLPAAASWGVRTNSRPPSSCSKQKPEMLINTSATSICTSAPAWHDDAISTSTMCEENRTMHLDDRCGPSESSKSVCKDSNAGFSISSADVGYTRSSSAWYDEDITSTKILEGNTETEADFRSGPVESSKLSGRDSSKAFSKSAWYDDEILASSIPDNCHEVISSSQPGPLDSSKQMIRKELPGSSSLVDISQTKEISAWDDDMVATSSFSTGNNAPSLEPCPQVVSESGVSGEYHVSVPKLSAEISAPLAFVSSSSTGHSCSRVTLEKADISNFIAADVNLINNVYSEELDQTCYGISAHNADRSSISVHDKFQDLSSQLSILNIDEPSGITMSSVDVNHSSSISGLQHVYTDNGVGSSYFATGGDSIRPNDITDSRILPDWSLEAAKLVSDAKLAHEPSDAVTQSSHLAYTSGPIVLSSPGSNYTDAYGPQSFTGINSQASKIKVSQMEHLPKSDSIFPNGYTNSKYSCSEVGKDLRCVDTEAVDDNINCLGRLNNQSDLEKDSVGAGESSIISNILTMDFDPWDDSLTSERTFSKLFTDADEQNVSLKLSNLWGRQSNQQSRFSFARQESQASFAKTSFGENANTSTGPISHDSLGCGIQSGLTTTFYENLSTLNNDGHSIISSDRSAVVLRAKTSAPPGFSIPNRMQAPPPGFSSQERFKQPYETTSSDNLVLGGASLRSDYQMPSSGNIGDVEFIDPAILAVGKGRLHHVEENSGFDMRYTLPSQFRSSEIDPRLQLLMQQSVSHQDPRTIENFGARFLPSNDSYVSSRSMHQSIPSSSFNQTSFRQSGNAHWEGWNDMHGNSESGLNEILRNKRFGLSRYFPGHEEKFQTGDIYNRGFRM